MCMRDVCCVQGGLRNSSRKILILVQHYKLDYETFIIYEKVPATFERSTKFLEYSPYARTFKKFPVQDKVSETFIVHEKVQEILLMYNKVSELQKHSQDRKLLTNSRTAGQTRRKQGGQGKR